MLACSDVSAGGTHCDAHNMVMMVLSNCIAEGGSAIVVYDVLLSVGYVPVSRRELRVSSDSTPEPTRSTS